MKFFSKAYLVLTGIWFFFGIIYGFGLAVLAAGQDGTSAIFIYIGPCMGLGSALIHGAVIKLLIKVRESLISFAPLIAAFLITFVFGSFVYATSAIGFFSWEFLFSFIPTIVAAVTAQIYFKKYSATSCS